MEMDPCPPVSGLKRAFFCLLLLLILGVYAEPVWDRFATGRNTLLRRPVSVGEIVEQVKRLLPR